MKIGKSRHLMRLLRPIDSFDLIMAIVMLVVILVGWWIFI
jgi:hypothetical protein